MGRPPRRSGPGLVSDSPCPFLVEGSGLPRAFRMKATVRPSGAGSWPFSSSRWRRPVPPGSPPSGTARACSASPSARLSSPTRWNGGAASPSATAHRARIPLPRSVPPGGRGSPRRMGRAPSPRAPSSGAWPACPWAATRPWPAPGPWCSSPAAGPAPSATTPWPSGGRTWTAPPCCSTTRGPKAAAPPRSPGRSAVSAWMTCCTTPTPSSDPCPRTPRSWASTAGDCWRAGPPNPSSPGPDMRWFRSILTLLLPALLLLPTTGTAQKRAAEAPWRESGWTGAFATLRPTLPGQAGQLEAAGPIPAEARLRIYRVEDPETFLKKVLTDRNQAAAEGGRGVADPLDLLREAVLWGGRRAFVTVHRTATQALRDAAKQTDRLHSARTLPARARQGSALALEGRPANPSVTEIVPKISEHTARKPGHEDDESGDDGFTSRVPLPAQPAGLYLVEILRGR